MLIFALNDFYTDDVTQSRRQCCCQTSALLLGSLLFCFPESKIVLVWDSCVWGKSLISLKKKKKRKI